MIQITAIRSLRRFFLVTILALLPTTALAYVPWHWQTSLRIQTPGDAMYMPSAVGFDKESKRYYVVDTGRDRLVSFGSDGKVIKAFTAGNRLKAPFDMVRLDNGQLWVVEKGRNSLTLIDIAAKEVKPFTLHDGKRQVFPARLADDGKNLYVLDRASGQVLRLDSNLAVVKHFDCGDSVGGLSDFVVDKGSVLALDTLGKKVFRFHADGTVADTIQLGSRVDFPVSLAVGPSGFIYVLDRHQSRVLVYTPDGKFKYSFLSLGQGSQQVYFPRELRFDPWGHLCVVDEGNGRVEIFSRF
jgi:DNA-binding beta-propeller fold protein YncE